MPTLLPEGKQSFTNSAGAPLIGGKVYTYDAGTSTPRVTYQDSAGTIPNTNPVILDARGEATIFWSGAYKVTLKDASDVTVWTVDGVSSADVYALAVLTSLAAASGSTLVGHAPLVGAPTTVRDALRKLDLKTVNVHDYVTGGLGTRASPWTGWSTGIAWTSHTQYDFLDGVYGYTVSPNFGLDFLRLNTKAGTVLRHTGTGYAMLVDAGPLATDFRVEIDIKCRLESNVAATGGVYFRGCSRSYMDIKFNDVPGVQFLELGGVLNTLRLYQSAFVTGQSIVPITMLLVDQRTVSEPTSAGTYYLMAENCSGAGVVLEKCLNGVFIGGTSEANGSGYSIGPDANYNTFIGIDLEINTTVDITSTGSFNTFINTISTKSVSFGGRGNSIIGGAFNTITNTGDTNDFLNVRYSNAGGAFTDAGVKTSKRNVYNLSTAVADIDVTPAVAALKSGSGSVSAANGVATTLFALPGTGRYEVFAYITSADAVNFASFATVLQEGGGARRIVANNGTLLILTVSGANVQATQTSGGLQTVSYTYVRING